MVRGEARGGGAGPGPLMLMLIRMRLERLVPSLARELLENRSMKVNCKHEGQLQSFKREQFSIFTQYVDSGSHVTWICGYWITRRACVLE